MTSTIPSLSLELSASIFATAALREGAVASFVSGDTFAVLRPTSGGAGTILPFDDLRATLVDDFGADSVEKFLRALQSGRLHEHRYDLKEGVYRTAPDGPSEVLFSKEKAIALQDPRARDANALTRSGVYLENLPRIGRDVFEEGVLRALSRERPQAGDLLWLHAGESEVKGSAVTSSIVVGHLPPRNASARDYRATPDRFPLIPLERSETAWEILPRYVIGASAVRDRVLEAVAETPWPVSLRAKLLSVRVPRKKAAANRATVSEPAAKTERLRTPPPPPPPKPPRKTDLRVLADVFTWPDRDQVYWNRPGMVGMTKVGILAAQLALIPKEYFDRAVRWCLGARDPREGDKILFTAGAGFSKNSRIRDCLFVTPSVPRSRSSDAYPKAWMEYRAGRWVLLPRESTGEGYRLLIDAVLNFPEWDLVQLPAG